MGIDIDNLLIDPMDLFQKLNRLMLSMDETEISHMKISISDSIKIRKINIWEIANAQLVDGSGVFKICRCLQLLASCLDIKDIEMLIAIYKKMNDLMVSDMISRIQYDITKEICVTKPEYIESLLVKLSETDEPFTIGHIATILESKSNNSFDAVFEQVLNMGYSGTENQILIAINSLVRINNSIDLSEKLQEIIALFYVLKSHKNDRIDAVLIWAIGRFMERYELFKPIFIEYAAYDNASIKYEISNRLLFQSGRAQEDWFKTSLFALATTPYAHKGIIHNLDMILHDLIQSENNNELVEAFLFCWTLNSDIADSDEHVHEHLNTFVYEAIKNSLFLKKFLTKSLFDENYKVHKFLSSFLGHLPIVGTDKLQLEYDEELLLAWSKEDYIFACRKILAWFYHFDLQSSLVWAFLKPRHLDKNVKNIVQEVLVEFIGKNFPERTIKYLEEGIDKKIFSKTQVKIASDILQILIKRQDAKQAMPVLNELRPSIIQTRLIAREENKSMQKSIDQAKEKSIFRKLAKEIPIKYGRGNVSMHNEQCSDVNYFQSFSAEAPMPLSEIINPINSSLQRLTFKFAKKGDK